MYEIPVWRMIKEAVLSIGGNVISNAEIRNYIFDHYGAVNQGTINAQIIVCSVNRQSRINFPENHKPRTADGQYDFLFYVDRGLVTLYDPDRHGKWEIALQDGKPVVRRIDSRSGANIPSKLENEPMTIAHASQRRDRLNHDIERPNRDMVKRYPTYRISRG